MDAGSPRVIKPALEAGDDWCGSPVHNWTVVHYARFEKTLHVQTQTVEGGSHSGIKVV